MDNIIFGNIPKHLTFPNRINNVIYFNTNLYEPEDSQSNYLEEMEKAFADIMVVDWYQKKDIPIKPMLPTFRHLNLLLESFGHKRKEVMGKR